MGRPEFVGRDRVSAAEPADQTGKERVASSMGRTAGCDQGGEYCQVPQDPTVLTW